MFFVHLIPDFLKEGAGNWKDITSRTQILKEMDFSVCVLHFNPEFPKSILSDIPSDTTDILIEYSWWPELLEEVRKRHPKINIHLRVHNAEAFQNYSRQGFHISPTIKTLKLYYGCIRLAIRDSRCKQLADTIWGISPWDNKVYWSRLPGNAKLHYVPYVCPWPLINSACSSIISWGQRENLMVSMPGMSDRIGHEMQKGYELFIKRSISHSSNVKWNYFISGGLGGKRKVSRDIPLDIIPEPFDPWRSLTDSRVLAVLGDKGFGYKTNITDGLVAGCHVLVHHLLFKRLPPEIKPLCIPCNPMNSQSINKALEQIQSPPRQPNIIHNAIVCATKVTIREILRAE